MITIEYIEPNHGCTASATTNAGTSLVTATSMFNNKLPFTRSSKISTNNPPSNDPLLTTSYSLVSDPIIVIKLYPTPNINPAYTTASIHQMFHGGTEGSLYAAPSANVISAVENA